jgi:hypothetical protein
MKGCSTQQTCLCSIDIKKVTTQQATTQCDLLSAMEKKLFFMQKKNKRKKGLMERRQILTYILQHAMTIVMAMMMTPLQEKKGCNIVSPPL